MATKKAPGKKAAGSGTVAEKPAVKAAAKKAPANMAVDLQASGGEQPKAAAHAGTQPAAQAGTQPVAQGGPQASSQTAAKAAPKAHPTQHDIQVQAYLLWERDGKKHGHHDRYWQQAERELRG